MGNTEKHGRSKVTGFAVFCKVSRFSKEMLQEQLAFIICGSAST